MRRGQESDADWIARLYHDVWHETHGPLMPPEVAALRPLAFFEGRMPQIVGSCVVGLDQDQRGLGFCAWQEAVLGQLWVVPEARGTGLAKTLLDAALATMADEGHATATLHCFAPNERGLHFYLREGWKQVELADVQATVGSDVLVPFWRLEKVLKGGHRCAMAVPHH